MRSAEIQQTVYDFCVERGLDKPYGVLLGDGVSRNGKKFLSVTFCRPFTLDATVEIYNRNFMVLRSSQTPYNSDTYDSVEKLMEKLETL